MNAEAAALCQSWSVGTFTATMTVPMTRPGQTASASIEWEPHVPERLTPEEFEQYRAGRAAAVQALGLKALVIEL